MGCNQSADGQVHRHANGFSGNKPSNSGPLLVQEAPTPPPGEALSKEAVTQAILERYLALEKEIAEAEKGSPGTALQHKTKQVAELDEKIVEQTKKVSELESQTAKEKKDVDDLEVEDTKKLFLEQGTWEEKQRKEMREYLDAKNKEEIAAKELDNMKEQKNNLDNEISELTERKEKLDKLYQEQEELLDQIFDGEYGSDDENRMENILDQHEQMRTCVVKANFIWRQAQLMIDYACKQLQHAVTKWEAIKELGDDDLEGRYAMASEVRNNLVAAAQNITGAQRYLSNVEFPYCAPAEVDTLNKATSYIFTDMQTEDRHAHAHECYSVTAKRCGALLQWVNQVVTQTISRDLDDINAKVKEASVGLRRERVRLIRIKAKEVLGRDVDIPVNEDALDTDVNVELNFNDLAKTEGVDPNAMTLTPTELAMLAALTADEELAPPPSDEQVFGEKMEQLNQEFKEDQDRLDKQISENQARVSNNLQEKLAARRQRRRQRNTEAEELKQLANGGGGGK